MFSEMFSEMSWGWERMRRDGNGAPRGQPRDPQPPSDRWLDAARERLEAGTGGDVDREGRLTRTGRTYLPTHQRTLTVWLRLREQVRQGALGGAYDGQRATGAPAGGVASAPPAARADRAAVSRRLQAARRQTQDQEVVAWWAGVVILLFLVADGVALWAASAYHLGAGGWLALLLGGWLALVGGGMGTLAVLRRPRRASADLPQASSGLRRDDG